MVPFVQGTQGMKTMTVHGANYILRNNNRQVQVFCLEADGGEMCLYAYDNSRKDARTGERPSVLVASVFADGSVELTPAWVLISEEVK